MQMMFTFAVNGRQHTVTTDADRPLLDVLREDLELTGTKCGCGEGQCGACTVLIDGAPTRSCVTAVSEAAGQSIQTIEGLAEEGRLHPVQEAFLTEGALQCGYCTPGLIMGTVGLLNEHSSPTEAQIFKALEGHICRCCGYPRIVKAVRRAVAEAGRNGQ